MPARGFSRLTALLNGLGTAWIFALMVLINADVVGRAGFNRPIPGVPELVEMSIVAIVFLQLAHTLGAGRIIRSEGFYGRLLARRPRAAHALGTLYNLTGAALSAIILYGTWPRLVRAWIEGHYVGNLGVFTAPVWPVKLIIVIGVGCLLVQFLICAWRDATLARGPNERWR